MGFRPQTEHPAFGKGRKWLTLIRIIHLKTTTEIDFQIQPWQRQDLFPGQGERFNRAIKAVDINVKGRGWSMREKRHRQASSGYIQFAVRIIELILKDKSN